MRPATSPARSSRSVLALTVVLVVTASIAGSEELDLERVVELALTQSPALQATIERRDEVEGGIREVRADAYPQIDLVSSWSRARNPSLLNSPDFEDIIDLIPDFRPAEQELWDVGFEVSQPVYSGGKIRAALDLARLYADVNEAQIRTAELDATLAAAEIFFQLLQALRAVETVEVQERAREEALAVAEARYELGDATQLELLRARASLAEIRPAIVAIRGRVEIERSRLRAALGLAPASEIAVVEDAPAEIVPAPEPRSEDRDRAGEADPFVAPPPVDTLLAFAREHRPELVDLRLQMEALDRRRVVTEADGRPQVDFSGLYTHQARLPENLDDSLFANWRAAFNVRWSLFDGGRRKGQVAQLESQREQLAWRLRDQESRIVLEIELARTEHETARARYRAAVVAARAAAEAHRVATEAYREGVALQSDLLDAQELETRAELLRLEAFYDGRVKAARLLRALGLLPTESWNSKDDTGGSR